MKRWILAGTAAVVGALAAATVVTYPLVGAVAYDVSMGFEHRVRGLEVRTADVDGLEMAYYDGGPRNAPAIVMLHGFSADKDLWVRFADPLTEDYRVIIPDLAGHGQTPFVAGADYSAPAQAARVLALLDRLGIERSHLIGNSMGGFVAATLALQHPGRVRSLGLSDAAGVTAPEPSVGDHLRARGRNPFLLEDRSQFAEF